MDARMDTHTFRAQMAGAAWVLEPIILPMFSGPRTVVRWRWHRDELADSGVCRTLAEARQACASSHAVFFGDQP